MSNSEKAPFPHCDPKVLHAPGACQYCDEYPEQQQARMEIGMSFTGEKHPKPGAIQDLAEQARPLEKINKWPGNRPHPKKG